MPVSKKMADPNTDCFAANGVFYGQILKHALGSARFDNICTVLKYVLTRGPYLKNVIHGGRRH